MFTNTLLILVKGQEQHILPKLPKQDKLLLPPSDTFVYVIYFFNLFLTFAVAVACNHQELLSMILNCRNESTEMERKFHTSPELDSTRED